MRTIFSVFLVIIVVAAGSYWYTSVAAVCKVPLAYRVGILDDRFGLSFDEARLAVADAESIWEEATGRNLFTYDPKADFVVNFIFDERQQLANDENDARQQLDASENINEALTDTYEQLVARYEKLGTAYEAKVASYEADLNRYNQTVASYNQEGGAPAEAFAALETERTQLDRVANEINAESRTLNDLVEQINAIGQQGNQLVERYNENVARYNNAFGDSQEFTQGDYRGDEINIYTFKDAFELQTVLAHELGHAISLDHVENEQSIMHYLLGGQTAPLVPTEADLALFQAQCGAVDATAALRVQLINLIKQLMAQLGLQAA